MDSILTQVSHKCYTSFTEVSHKCQTSVTQVAHKRHTSVTHENRGTDEFRVNVIIPISPYGRAGSGLKDGLRAWAEVRGCTAALVGAVGLKGGLKGGLKAWAEV